MADEGIDVVGKLWESWEPGAILADRAAGAFADPAKVKPIHHEGTYFKSRGPLNFPAGPQRRLVICKAGGSAAGRAFAAKHADTIVARNRGTSSAKAFRDDVSALMRANGRDPGACKVMFCVSIVLGETMREAEEKKERLAAALADSMETRLAALSFYSAADFSKFDLDAPLPEVKTNASQTMTAVYTAGAGRKTLREMLLDPSSGGIDFVGTPDSVAGEMGEGFTEIGGAGVLGFRLRHPRSRCAI